MGMEYKVVLAGELLGRIKNNRRYSARTLQTALKIVEEAIREIPYHRHQIDVNEMVCMFRQGTRIHVHMRYADKEFTERKWGEDAACGIWKGGDFWGVTRYPIGDCAVESGSVFIPALYGMKETYDVAFTAYEPLFTEKLHRKWAMEHGKDNED